MNRSARRAAAAKQRRQATPKDGPPPAPDRAALLGIVAAALDADETASGVTLIEPDGTITYLDAGVMRRGGRA